MERQFVGSRLSTMMFLEFFIWGAWYVTVNNFMDARGMGEIIFWAYTVGPIAAIASPFFLGLVADRFFATERVLGTMHLLGGAAMFLAPWAAGQSGTLFILVLLVHMLCFMPTLGLTNTLAFHHIRSQEKQFPIIRMFGTIGWIVANLVVSRVLNADEKSVQFVMAGSASFALGIFAFSLPHTPPPAAGRKVTGREIVGLDALKQLWNFPYLVFLACSFLICVPLAAYYAYASVFVKVAGFKYPAANMMFGQIAEVFFMLVMPFFFLRLGVKWMLAVGMAAWVLRYGLFAGAAGSGAMWMVILGITLHGICYDFFFVTGQIYTDKKATPEIRGQAQGFLVLITQGLGMLIGAQISGLLFNEMVGGTGDALRQSYQSFWLVPCIAAGVILVVFALVFRERNRSGVKT